MSAIQRFFELVNIAGVTQASKVAIGLGRMHWRYFLLGRGRGLSKILPMSTPMKIHVDAASGCNFRCFFCPQTDPSQLRARGVKNKIMTLNLFKKMIDDMRLFPKRVDELVLGNYGEPLLNKNIAEMIAYAKQAGVAREVSLITNASLLDRKCAEKIVAAGLDKIRISVEALSDQGYLETTLVESKFDDIVENVRFLKEEITRTGGKTFIYAKIIDIGLSMEEKRKFMKIFSSISDCASIENLMAVTPEAAKKIGEDKKGMTGVSYMEERRVCPSPFYSISVHSDGNVAVCCADWHHKTVVGSIVDETLLEIWTGERMRDFRMTQLTKGHAAMEACEGCAIVKSYPAFEDLDEDVAKLIECYRSPLAVSAN